MKTKLTQFFKKCAMVAFVLYGGIASAATFTAVSSGSWSSTTTWSGGLAPGGSIAGVDNVVINSDVVVNMDMNVTVSSVFSSVQVNGTLNSSGTYLLDINSGALSGNGTLNLSNLRFGTLGSMSFTGTADIDHLHNNATLSLVGQLYLNDTLFLEAGNLSTGTGGYLNLQTNSVVKVDGGGMSLGTGIVSNTSSYDVVYVGASKTSGLELSGSGLNQIWIDLSNNTQTLTLGEDITADGVIHHDMGTLNLNGYSFTIMGDYVSTSGVMISGSNTSNLILHNFSSGTTSHLVFSSSNADLNNLWIETAGATGTTTLGSNLTIHGTLTLQHGQLNASAGTLTMASGSNIVVNDGHILMGSSSFNGTSAYSVTYNGSMSTTSGVELSGSGMSRLTLNLQHQTDSVEIMNNIVLGVSLNMQNGTLDMNGYNVTIGGTYNNDYSTGWFNGDANSDLTITSAIASTDTVMFDSNNNQIHQLTINTGNGGYLLLGTDLWVENLNLTNGGVAIWEDYTLNIRSTGNITGATSDNYVMIMDDGYLNMNVNNASPYVMFPVGTSDSYSPIGVQQNSGTVGYFSVGVSNGVLSAGESGANLSLTQSIVDRTWDVEPVSATGSHNVNILVQWDASMEVNGFDRTHSYITHYTSGAWDVQTATAATSIAGGMYQAQRMNITSFSPFAVVDNNSTLGLHEVSKTSSIRLYPNPVNDYLNCIVNITEPTSVDLVNPTGEVVYSEKLNGKSGTINHTIDFSGLPNGIYFIRYNNSTGSTSYKVVKS